MTRFLLVCLGGAIGTGARYLVSGWALETLGPAFPFGTLLVNAVGSFLLSIIMFAGIEAAAISPTTRLVLGTGVMGGFTTYSTFNYETLRYVDVGQWGTAALYVLSTLVVCFVAGVAGWMLARTIMS